MFLAPSIPDFKASCSASGYMHPAYAASLSQFGVPNLLPESKGWFLCRRIPFSDCFDGMGSYPIFACEDWSRLHTDLENLGELVSISMVSDPFGEYDERYLRRCFRDIVVPFKEHFIVDLTRDPASFVSEHHRRNAKRARLEVSVERCVEPIAMLDEWVALYAFLADRHKITGMRAFSRSSFTAQLEVPGITVFRASVEEKTVGMTLWYEQKQAVGYYHLGAYSEIGYDLLASFALFSFAIEHFAAAGLKWLSLGAGAGTDSKSNDGLTRFKRGWSTGTRTAYFCGRIFDRPRYLDISTAIGVPATDYFPAYRSGEFI